MSTNQEAGKLADLMAGHADLRRLILESLAAEGGRTPERLQALYAKMVIAAQGFDMNFTEFESATGQIRLPGRAGKALEEGALASVTGGGSPIRSGTCYYRCFDDSECSYDKCPWLTAVPAGEHSGRVAACVQGFW